MKTKVFVLLVAVIIFSSFFISLPAQENVSYDSYISQSSLKNHAEVDEIRESKEKNISSPILSSDIFWQREYSAIINGQNTPNAFMGGRTELKPSFA